MITIFLLFLLYLHESKVNYRKFLEQQFIQEVREITLRDFKAGLFANEENQGELQDQSHSENLSDADQ